jgi:hypothetical protein
MKTCFFLETALLLECRSGSGPRCQIQALVVSLSQGDNSTLIVGSWEVKSREKLSKRGPGPEGTPGALSPKVCERHKGASWLPCSLAGSLWVAPLELLSPRWPSELPAGHFCPHILQHTPVQVVSVTLSDSCGQVVWWTEPEQCGNLVTSVSTEHGHLKRLMSCQLQSTLP